MTLFPIPALTFIPMQLNLCRETVAITYFNFLYQLATSVEATQLYDQASPAQQKNAAIVNSLFQLHQSVTKVTLSIRQPLTDHSRNTITYHNALCLSPQNLAYWNIVFSFSWGHLSPKRNWRHCLCKILGWQAKSIMVCYGIFWSGQLPPFATGMKVAFCTFLCFYLQLYWGDLYDIYMLWLKFTLEAVKLIIFSSAGS